MGLERNSYQFLFAFNRIEKFLHSLKEEHGYVPFYQLVRNAEKSNAVVRKYKNDLLELADLRNAIVHERTDPHYTIAEPHDETVERILLIEKELTEPKTVIPYFSKKVHSFQADVSLSHVLYTIKNTTFTRFPVYDNDTIIGLITEKGIAHWLAQNIEEEEISIKNTKLRDLLQYEQVLNNHIVLDRNASIYEAAEIFIDRLHQNKRIDAILITHSGKRNEKLLGIITLADMINLR